MNNSNTVKMSILPQLIYKFNKIPIKIPTKRFGNIDKIILKFIWEGKGTRIARTFVLEKNKEGGISPSDFGIL